jgi:hypothetical protein
MHSYLSVATQASFVNTPRASACRNSQRARVHVQGSWQTMALLIIAWLLESTKTMHSDDYTPRPRTILCSCPSHQRCRPVLAGIEAKHREKHHQVWYNCLAVLFVLTTPCAHQLNIEHAGCQHSSQLSSHSCPRTQTFPVKGLKWLAHVGSGVRGGWTAHSRR